MLFRRLFQSALLVLTVSLVPCTVFWFRTGNSRGLEENALADTAGVQIQVDQERMPVENFLISMVSVDYQPDMEEEALKALAVAARSSLYAHLNRYLQDLDHLSGTDRETVLEAEELGVMYHKPEEMIRAFQEAADRQGNGHWSKVYENVKNAVQATAGQYLIYADSHEQSKENADSEQVRQFTPEEAPVDALWHAVSAGSTRFYEGNLTGKEDGISLYSPQLKSMNGKDGELPCAVGITVYTRRQLARLLWEIPGTEEILDEEISLSSYFKIEKRDNAGYIEELSLGDRKMTGEEAAELLQLASGCFYVSDLPEGNLKFTVYGSGRGYGMSLAGASSMALQGAGYREILEYYFPVCQLNNLSVFWTE